MANFGELSGIKQWGLVFLGGVAVTAALYFTVFKSQNEKNTSAQHALEDKIRENNELESYRPKLKQIEQQLAELKQQLDQGGHRTAALHGQGHQEPAVLHRGSVRHGIGRAVLLGAEFL